MRTYFLSDSTFFVWLVSELSVSAYSSEFLRVHTIIQCADKGMCCGQVISDGPPHIMLSVHSTDLEGAFPLIGHGTSDTG